MLPDCDTVELLESIEDSLDEVSCLVAIPVDFSFGVAISSGWDECPLAWFSKLCSPFDLTMDAAPENIAMKQQIFGLNLNKRRTQGCVS